MDRLTSSNHTSSLKTNFLWLVAEEIKETGCVEKMLAREDIPLWALRWRLQEGKHLRAGPISRQ